VIRAGDRVEVHGGENQAARRYRRQKTPPSQRGADAARRSSPSLPTARRSTRFITGRRLLSGGVNGKLFIEMSTVQPRVETASRSAEGAGQGRRFRRMPVGGSTARLGQGNCSAHGADASRSRGGGRSSNSLRKVEHCGPVGAGSSMKLAINLPLMVAWQAYGEAFAIARCGVDCQAAARSLRREQRRQ